MAKPSSKQRGLGRGLSALMADVSTEVPQTEASPAARADSLIPIEKIKPNPDQPRRKFDQEALDELSKSIREKGVIQPLVVRPSPKKAGEFEIVAGERRWRASQLAQLHELPVVIREFSDTEVLEVAIIENIQRADLNAIEEAVGYKQLMDKFGHTQEQLSKALGKSRSHIANLLRLLNLPETVQKFVVEGELSAGHARALVTSENPEELAKRIISEGLSVRETEKLAKQEGAAPKKAPKAKISTSKDADTRSLEADLSATLGMKVAIDHKEGSESGKISLSYKDLEQLDELCQLLSKGI